MVAGTADPCPLVAPYVDLRDFPFMPLELERLRRSKAWLLARRRPEIGFYSLNLWARSWHEVPAASLEDDEDVLADAAMCDPSRWHEVRDDALRGWLRCSDGRLYHPIVAEKARDAWARKSEQRQRTLRARISSMQKRLDGAKTDGERTHVRGMLDGLLADLATFEACAAGGVADPVTDRVTGSVADPVAAPVTATKRQGQGERQGEGESRIDSPADADALPVKEAFTLYQEAAKRHAPHWVAHKKLAPDLRTGILRILREWGGLEGWRDGLAAAEASAFLTGRGARGADHAGWKVSLDFLANPKKFRRLMDGAYSDVSCATTSAAGSARTASWQAGQP